jgi:hypothetical protein
LQGVRLRDETVEILCTRPIVAGKRKKRESIKAAGPFENTEEDMTPVHK